MLAIAIFDDGRVEFAEQCDSWFGVAVTPEIAVAALEEAIAWIRANAKEPANARLSGCEPTPDQETHGLSSQSAQTHS